MSSAKSSGTEEPGRERRGFWRPTTRFHRSGGHRTRHSGRPFFTAQAAGRPENGLRYLLADNRTTASRANASGDGPAGNPPTLRRHVLRKLYKWISLTETGQPFDIRVFGRNVTSLVQYGIGLPMQAIVATARLQQQALPIHYRRSATGAADSSEGVAPQQHEGIPAHTQQGLRIGVFASRAKR